jgi:hypothetical protein
MAELEPREVAFAQRMRRTQRAFALAGVVIALLGAAYTTWGLLRFDPHHDPRENPGFDRPVAQLAFLFQRGYEKIENTVAETPTEARLLHALQRNMEFSTGVMLMLMRVFLGLFALVTGMVTMTVVYERHRLLQLIKRLQE